MPDEQSHRHFLHMMNNLQQQKYDKIRVLTYLISCAKFHLKIRLK